MYYARLIRLLFVIALCFFVFLPTSPICAEKVSIEQLQDNAENGDTTAQLSLGMMYETGEGVKQDYHKAREWYEKVAEQGDDLAQWLLGNIFLNGKGIKQDYKKAKEWYEKAAEQGSPLGQESLAYL